ncbi:hypothetical protein KBB68_00870 [Candidatus Babeliales bacterium]|nr:hypothetical protein [Candidatus Babeliales bacterium]
MNNRIYLIVILTFGSIYSADSVEKFAVALPAEPTDQIASSWDVVALPTEPTDQVASSWNYDEFDSILPDYLVYLITTEAIFGNEVTRNGLRSEVRQADPVLQVKAVEGMVEQRRYAKNTKDYETYICGLTDKYVELLKNHTERLAIAEDGFDNVTESVVNFLKRKKDDEDKEAVRYKALSFWTKFKLFVKPRWDNFLNDTTSNFDPATKRAMNETMEELNSLSIPNPKEIIMNVMSVGLNKGLNILKDSIKALKERQKA